MLTMPTMYSPTHHTVLAISRQRPTTNIKSDMVCVKLIENTELMLILFWYIDNIVMLNFIPWVLLV